MCVCGVYMWCGVTGVCMWCVVCMWSGVVWCVCGVYVVVVCMWCDVYVVWCVCGVVWSDVVYLHDAVLCSASMMFVQCMLCVHGCVIKPHTHMPHMHTHPEYIPCHHSLHRRP